MYGKKSPAEMGHSPMKKESAKQEKKNLLKDMPVDKRASAMQMGHESPAKMGHESPMKMAGSWMSKHSNSALHFNKPEHNHTHAGGDKNANTPHGGNVRTSGNTSKKDLAKLTQKNRARDARETQQARLAKKLKDKENNQSPTKMGHDSPAKNLGHGMDKMSAEKGAHREYHLKQRLSKKSKDSVAEMKYSSPAGKHCM